MTNEIEELKKENKKLKKTIRDLKNEEDLDDLVEKQIQKAIKKGSHKNTTTF